MSRSDNYNRADTGAGGLGTPSDGGSPWDDLSSVFQISSNRAKSTGGAQALAVLTDTSANTTLQVTVVVGASSDIWIPFRFSDGNNYWIAVLGSSDGPRLFKRVSGSFSQVGSTGSGTLSAGTYVVSIVANGTSIELLVDGVTKVGPITDSFLQTAVKHGIGSNGDSTTTFENFSTTDFSTGFTLSAAQGSYTISGQNANLSAIRSLIASHATYTLTGQDATLTKATPGSFVLTANYGEYTWIGEDALADYAINANYETYLVTGQDVTFSRSFPQAYSLIANSGSYLITGNSARLVWSNEVVSLRGNYTISMSMKIGI